MHTLERRRKQRIFAKVLRSKVTAAERGDALAARSLLHAAVDAIAEIDKGKDVMEADLVALRFLEEGLRNFLARGIGIERALGIERSRGAPRKPDVRPLFYMEVAGVLDRQRAKGMPVSVDSALQVVATRRRKSKSSIKAAWQAVGGLSYYKKNLRKDK
ncbi:MAG: hypothetical protein K2Y31_06395 [Burkholderiales bacterium]|jgi:hypothetical protein|nr:hypothetical protein [Burkholderiales bacterium]